MTQEKKSRKRFVYLHFICSNICDMVCLFVSKVVAARMIKKVEFCYGVSGVPDRYLEVHNIFFNLSR
jgi:hypothetical protein